MTEPPDPVTPARYWAALDAGDWATVHKVNGAVADQMEKEADELEKKGERSAALGKRFDAQRIRNCTLAPLPRPERE